MGMHVAVSSRHTSFTSEIAVAAGSADVVLNTLTSPGMVAATLACLSHGGHLIELSKRCAANCFTLHNEII